jgi:hypothetical protein
MAGGSWDPTALPTRAGLYINFVSAAVAQITGGARGTVAIPLKTYTGTATAKNFYLVEKEKDAVDLFGDANIQSIRFALQGGAKEVLVYTMPASPVTADYVDMRAAFDARPFNVFVYDGIVLASEQDATLTWVQANKADGKHFNVIFGCAVAADDLTPATGDARSIRLADDYAVNLINGVIVSGVAKNSAEYAPFVAGLIAGAALNRSVTYSVAPVDDVTRRMTNAEIKLSLSKGSFILVHDGEKVKVERGISTSLAKIRKVRAEMAIAVDITKTGADFYIGKLDNNSDGQKALIGSISAYLERLADSNVLVRESIAVGLDPNFQSVGDQVYLLISFVEVDSMEEIFLTISVGV